MTREASELLEDLLAPIRRKAVVPAVEAAWVFHDDRPTGSCRRSTTTSPNHSRRTGHNHWLQPTLKRRSIRRRLIRALDRDALVVAPDSG